jgi:hypothetical protein
MQKWNPDPTLFQPISDVRIAYTLNNVWCNVCQRLQEAGVAWHITVIDGLEA